MTETGDLLENAIAERVNGIISAMVTTRINGFIEVCFGVIVFYDFSDKKKGGAARVTSFDSFYPWFTVL